VGSVSSGVVGWTMPITMTCESCKKMFRARDESVGKRVKCPYCGAPMEVPAPLGEGGGSSPGGGIVGGTPMPGIMNPYASPSVANPIESRPGGSSPSEGVTPGDWGGSGATGRSESMAAGAVASTPAVPTRATLGRESAVVTSGARGLPASDFPDLPRTVIAPPSPSAVSPVQSKPHRPGYGRWRKTKAGLTMCLLGLFWLTIPGLVELGKMVYVRSGNSLPEGTGWISIPGYINDAVPGSIEMDKKKQLNILLYGVPVLLGSLFLGFGRMTCGAVPSEVGVRGAFALSGLFALLGGAALLTAGGAYVLYLEQEAKMALTAALLLGGIGEAWCLIALSTVAAHLGQARTARAVTLLVLFAGLWVAWVLYGNSYYLNQWRPQFAAQPDLPLWEQIAFALAYVLTIAVYWRAVASTRRAVRQQIASLEA